MKLINIHSLSFASSPGDNNYLTIKSNLGHYGLKYKNMNNRNNIIIDNNNIYTLNQQIYTLIKKISTGLIHGYIFILLLIGLFFRIQKISFNNHHYIRFRLGYSHYIYLFIPPSIIIKSLRINFINHILLYSTHYDIIIQSIVKIKNLKKFDIYKGKGFKLLHETIKLSKRAKK